MLLVRSWAVPSRNMSHGAGVGLSNYSNLAETDHPFIGFYINLPLGATTAIILVTFFRPNDRSSNDLPLLEKLAQLDLPGLLLFIPSVVMLLLALQWGGNKHAWKSATVIGLIIGFGLLMMVFLAWQWHQQDKASIPPRIIFNRTIYSAVTMAGLGLGSVQLIAYYIPLWFQVVKHASPVESGIRLLPTVLANLVASIGTGALSKSHVFGPFPSTMILIRRSNEIGVLQPLAVRWNYHAGHCWGTLLHLQRRPRKCPDQWGSSDRWDWLCMRDSDCPPSFSHLLILLPPKQTCTNSPIASNRHNVRATGARHPHRHGHLSILPILRRLGLPRDRREHLRLTARLSPAHLRSLRQRPGRRGGWRRGLAECRCGERSAGRPEGV